MLDGASAEEKKKLGQTWGDVWEPTASCVYAIALGVTAMPTSSKTRRPVPNLKIGKRVSRNSVSQAEMVEPPDTG